MPQVILKEQLIQPAKIFLQEILINIRKHHFHSSNNHQEKFFHRTLITSYFHPVNTAKFLRTAFFQNTSRSSRLQMFFKIGAQNSFANFTAKYLCWSLFLNNFIEKRLQHRNTSGDCFCNSGGCFCNFFKKVIKQLFPNFVMTY